MKDFQEISDSINEYMDSQKENIAELLTQLIGIRSVSNDENDIAEFLIDKMNQFGFDEAMIDVVGNVLGRVGNGETVLFYDAHIDTVAPGNAADWGFDPLEARCEGDMISGRGAVDNKACMAGMLYASKAIKDLGLEDDFTLWVCGSIVEEVATGSSLVALFNEYCDIMPRFILIGEPSGNRLIRGHKGKAIINITVPGKCAHAAAASLGENALTKSVPILDGLAKLVNLPADSFLGQGTVEATALRCESPSVNTIPGKVVITCDLRLACGETPEKIKELLKPVIDAVPGAVMDITEQNITTFTGYEMSVRDYCPSWLVSEDHEVIEFGRKTFMQIFKKEPVPGKWDFCTNATYVGGEMGIPCIGFGPGDGSLCHSAGERVSISELTEAAKFYALFPFAVITC